MTVRIIQTRSFSPFKCFYSSFFLSFFPKTNNSLCQNQFSESKPFPCYQVLHYSSPTAATAHRSQQIVDDLVAVFSKRSIGRNDEQLRRLGAKLTHDAVESVLKGLKNWKLAYEFFLWSALQEGFNHNCYTYNTMASILSHSRQTDLLKTLANNFLKSGCSTTQGALGFFIRCLGSQGLADDADHIFSNANKLNCSPNTYAYNCLLEALVRSNRMDMVEKRFQEMIDSGKMPDKFTLTPLLQAYCSGGKYKEALSVFERIQNEGWVDEHVFTILIVSFSKWGQVDNACELIQRMEDLGMTPNEKTLSVLIHVFSSEMRMDKAFEIFDKLKKLGYPRYFSMYKDMIEGLCKMDKVSDALNLYKEMKSYGIHGNNEITAKMVLELCKIGDLNSANKLIQDEGIDGNGNVLCLNALLEGLIIHGDVDIAHSLILKMIRNQKSPPDEKSVCSIDGDRNLEKMFDGPFLFEKHHHPNVDAFRMVIDGLCNANKLDAALELLKSMARRGYTRNLLIYNNLIHELCNGNRLDESYQLLMEMKDSGFEPTSFTYNSIFGCLCRREDVIQAIDLVKVMRNHGFDPWIKHYNMLVKQLCVCGKVAEARKFLDEMVQTGLLPDIIAYSTVMDGHCKNRELDQALELFYGLSEKYFPDVIAHNILIRGLCKEGRVSEAQDIISKMLEKGLTPSVVTFNSIIDGWCKIGGIDEALLLYSRMVDDSSRSPTVVTYSTLIHGLCDVSRSDEAVVIWNNMVNKGCNPNAITYMALVHGLCKCGKIDAAVDYFLEMEKKELEPDTYVYVSIFDGLVSNGKPLLAFEILQKMINKFKMPEPTDKYYLLLKNALQNLCKTDDTYSSLKNLSKESILLFNIVQEISEGK